MGPLSGIKVVEFAGLGPAPFCGMMLADMGAEVLRIDRQGGGADLLGQRHDVLARGRRSVALDLKKPQGVETALRLIAGAEVLLEGFRPGVMERLGLAPEICLERNPCLVYARMTGWGQDGPLAKAAGHDINYIALSGALSAIGTPASGPVPPLNLVGDFGGGGMLMAFGIACALVEAKRSGRGQVVDAAMADGAALLTAMIYSLKGNGLWPGGRGENLLDGGAAHYGTYQCADGKWVAIGPLEPQFHALFLEKCGIDDPDFADPADRSRWPRLRAKLEALFKSRPRAEWRTLLEGSDVCFAPVLDLDEAPAHPHNRARGSFFTRDGITQPAPAPRFDRTPAVPGGPPPKPGEHTEPALADWGFTAAEIAGLKLVGAI